jgi:uncharacterized protein
MLINEEMLHKGRDIIAEWINENIYVRKQLRRCIKELLLSAPSGKNKRRKSTKVSSIFRLVKPLSKSTHVDY